MIKKIFLTVVVVISLFLVLFCVAPTFGTSYYCDCSVSGGLGGDGSYGENAFESIADINAASSGFSDGDDLYFKYGTICEATEALDLGNWDGTSTGPDYMTIGCYDGEDDFDCTGKTLPIIQGNNSDDAGTDVPNCDCSLVSLTCGAGEEGYAEIKDIVITNSGHRGLSISGLDGVGCSGLKIENITVKETDTAAFGLWYWNDGTDDSTYNAYIKNSDFYNMNLTYSGEAPTNPSFVIGAQDDIGTTYDIHVSNIRVYNTEQAGIHFEKGPKDILLENSVIYNCRGDHIYLATAKNVEVRNNLVYQVGTANQFGSGAGTGFGIKCSNESWMSYCYNGEHKIHGNMVVGFDEAITLGCGSKNSGAVKCGDDGECKNVKVYNNTIIDTDDANFKFWGVWSTGNEIKNNISIQSGDCSGTCAHVNTCSPSNWTWDTNIFYGGTPPSSGDCTTNDSNSDPFLAGVADWWGLTANQLDGSEFAPTSGSAAIDAGVSIVSYNQRIAWSDFTASPTDVDLTTNAPYGSAPDIGAFEFALDNAPSITAPTGTNQGTSGTFTLTRNNQTNQTDYGHDATSWKICPSGGGACETCTATWSDLKEETNITSISYSGLSEDTSYNGCGAPLIGLDGESVVDDGEMSPWDTESFSTGGQPPGGQSVDANVITGTGTIRIDTEQSGSGTKNVDIGP